MIDTGRDVVDILTEDHQEALDLIGQIKSSPDPSGKRDLTDTLIAEIVRHSVAEEMYVYPMMRERLEDGDAAVQHDIEEHQELVEVMKKLEDADPASGAFAEHMAHFETVLRDHVADEEAEQFPALRVRVQRSELVSVGEKVEIAKKLAPTRPHPSAPHSELFHKTVAPGVGFIDRLRDLLSDRGAS
jgi:hypothetical protein